MNTEAYGDALDGALRRIATLEAAIKQHNDEITSECENEYNRNARRCDAWTDRGRRCPECPKYRLIDVP